MVIILPLVLVQRFRESNLPLAVPEEVSNLLTGLWRTDQPRNTSQSRAAVSTVASLIVVKSSCGPLDLRQSQLGYDFCCLTSNKSEQSISTLVDLKGSFRFDVIYNPFSDQWSFVTLIPLIDEPCGQTCLLLGIHIVDRPSFKGVCNCISSASTRRTVYVEHGGCRMIPPVGSVIGPPY